MYGAPDNGETTKNGDWATDKGQNNAQLGKWAAVAGGAALAAFLGYRSIKGKTDGKDADQGIQVKESVTIMRPAEELYSFWRNFENLPQFMKHLESVKVLDNRRSHWKAKAPAGMTVEWDAEITQEQEPSLIAWRSVEKAQVPNQGSVRFETLPANRGTKVSIDLRYDPPAGKIGAAIAKLFREEPGQQVEGDMRRFKNLMESSEIPTTEGQPHGKRSTTAKLAETVTGQ